jgi:hypothetical protein
MLDREPNIWALQTFIAKQPIDGELIILVTHFVTISEITQQAVSSGEGVALKLITGTPEALLKLMLRYHTNHSVGIKTN